MAEVVTSVSVAPPPTLGRRHADKIVQMMRPQSRLLAWGTASVHEWLHRYVPSTASLTTVCADHPERAQLCSESAQFDLILVDGESAGSALATVRPLLAPGGTVILHGSQHVRHDEAKLAYTNHGHIGSCPDRPGEELWWGGDELEGNARATGALPVVVSFFTTGTDYEIVAQRLMASCQRLNLEHRVVGVAPRGSWESNCNIKPEFIFEVWQETGRPVLWVDADAVLHGEPNLLRSASADFAIHRCFGWVFASGTVFFNQSPAAVMLLRRWLARCRAYPRVWDQVNLDLAWEDTSAVMPLETLWLPEPYCRIFDQPQGGSSRAGVIEHFQASRQLKAKVSTAPNVRDALMTPGIKAARLASRRRASQLLPGEAGVPATLSSRIADAVLNYALPVGRMLCMGPGLRALASVFQHQGNEVHALHSIQEEWVRSGGRPEDVPTVTALPQADGYFEGVICFGELELLPESEVVRALSEIRRVARHAVLVVVHTRPDAEERWPDQDDQRSAWVHRLRAAGFDDMLLPGVVEPVAGFVWRSTAEVSPHRMVEGRQGARDLDGARRVQASWGYQAASQSWGSETVDIQRLAEGLSEALGAALHTPTADAEWLERVDTEAAELAARLVHESDSVALECHVRRLAPSLPARFAVYGASSVGRWLAQMASEVGRPALAFIETSADAEMVDGLPVWRPARARDEGIRCVVLGTRASAAEMQARLSEAYAGCLEPLRIERLPSIAALPRRLPAVDRALDVVRRGRTLSEYLWLLRRADERMDAALPVNPAVRRLFHADRYVFAAQHAAGARVLDCASGTGYGSRWLARYGGAASVLGIDVDPEAVAYAHRHHGGHGVSFLQGDACALDDLPSASVDLIASFETIEHVPDDRAMLAEFARLLAPGGHCIISTPNDWPVETSRYHVRSYDATGFERALRAWFIDVTLFAHVVPSEDGRGGVVPWRGQSRTEAECLVAVCRTPRQHQDT